MASNTHTLTAEHQWFIDENRHDPVTHKTFSIGDQIVVCANCKKVFKATTWDEVGHCIECRHTNTHSQFLTKPEQSEPLVIGRGRGGQSQGANRTGIGFVGERRLYNESSRVSWRRNESRLREQRQQTLRKALYYIILGLITLIVGAFYSMIWFSNFSEATGTMILYIISVIALLVLNIGAMVYWADEELIERNWNYFWDGFWKSSVTIIVIYIAMYFLSWLIFIIINAVTG